MADAATAQRLRRLIHLSQQEQQLPSSLGAKSSSSSSAPAAAAAAAAADVVTTDGLTKEEIYTLRKRHFSKAQSISYENTSPLLIVKGERQRLFDEAGVSYLDTRNNVGHVGHANPKVAAAVAAQVGQLNTNTRYLHPNISRLAEKLTATMPEELSVVFFVNSGSEANDLAMRLARAHTGNDDFVVVEHAYHGHTTAVIDISPYKYEHVGGEGQKEWVHKVPCPDTYRGVYGEDEPNVGEKYAGFVAEACEQAAARDAGETGVAGFFIESGMSVAGVILPPPGYLEAAYKHVRAAGGICVADEVQVGFGRFGKHYWGFQQQGVTPDIVTMGKPFGNGMPLAAVVTTLAVSESFNNGLEYFNTFGGNPVCAAAGLAVMEIIEEEGLQEHALKVGDHLTTSLTALMEDYEVIGAVRGSGLFIGIEFVSDRTTKEPGSAETSYIVSSLKDDANILTSIDGPHDNVLVMKPPMCFDIDDANVFLAALAGAMDALAEVDLSSISHTPT